MKKLLIILITVLLLVAIVTGCNSTGDNDNKNNSTTNNSKSAQSNKKALSNLLTSHKWQYSLQEQEKGSIKLSYKWTLDIKDNGTWAMDMNNSVDDYSTSFTLKGKWELNGTKLTVVSKNKKYSEFNFTDVLKFADNITDDKIEKNGIKSIITTNPDDALVENFFTNTSSSDMRWYVSDNYFCYYSILFTAK